MDRKITGKYEARKKRNKKNKEIKAINVTKTKKTYHRRTDRKNIK